MAKAVNKDINLEIESLEEKIKKMKERMKDLKRKQDEQNKKVYLEVGKKICQLINSISIEDVDKLITYFNNKQEVLKELYGEGFKDKVVIPDETKSKDEKEEE